MLLIIFLVYVSTTKPQKRKSGRTAREEREKLKR